MDAVKFYNSGSKGGHERAFTNPAPKGKTTMDKKVGISIVYVLALRLFHSFRQHRNVIFCGYFQI